MNKFSTLLFILVGVCLQSFGQPELIAKRDPRQDLNLSPIHNNRINPQSNANINPKHNWNINPLKNTSINPRTANKCNPMVFTEFNPVKNQILNPQFVNNLHPLSPNWRGMYLFDKDDNLIGFVSVASQEVMLCFDKQGEWTCYFTKTALGTFNQFTLNGEWTGEYLCYDSSMGYNCFANNGDWTGKHIK